MFTLFYGHRAISCIGHRRIAKDKAVQRLYGDPGTEIVQRLCDDRADIIRSYDFCTMLFCSPVEEKKSYARCMISARPPHDDPALVRCHLRCV